MLRTSCKLRATRGRSGGDRTSFYDDITAKIIGELEKGGFPWVQPWDTPSAKAQLVGAATWLATELYDDEDSLFGLADLGFGCPELGSFSLIEMASVRLPFGLGIERNLHFEGIFPLSVYAEAARRAGRIVFDERLLEGKPPATAALWQR